MRHIMLVGLLLVMIASLIVIYAFADATEETGDVRAVPITLYGKTSGGALKVLLVDSNGVVQTTN